MLKNRPPDVTARELDDARRILSAWGWSVAETGVTHPPGGPNIEGGVLRVARQRVLGRGQIALTLVRACREKG